MDPRGGPSDGRALPRSAGHAPRRRAPLPTHRRGGARGRRGGRRRGPRGGCDGRGARNGVGKRAQDAADRRDRAGSRADPRGNAGGSTARLHPEDGGGAPLRRGGVEPARARPAARDRPVERGAPWPRAREPRRPLRTPSLRASPAQAHAGPAEPDRRGRALRGPDRRGRGLRARGAPGARYRRGGRGERDGRRAGPCPSDRDAHGGADPAGRLRGLRRARGRARDGDGSGAGTGRVARGRLPGRSLVLPGGAPVLGALRSLRGRRAGAGGRALPGGLPDGRDGGGDVRAVAFAADGHRARGLLLVEARAAGALRPRSGAR